MYLNQGVDAEKEVEFDSEKKHPLNASVNYDKDRVTENDKSVPII